MGAATPDEPVNENQSWDEFWASNTAKRRKTEVIRGIEVDVPFDLPLSFTDHVEELSDSEDEQDVKDLVAELFGEDVFEAWVEEGMGSVEFQTILAWGMAHGQGAPITFAEAYELVASGKGPTRLEGNRATRRAKAARRGSSAATGGPSKRTSGGSTGSRRKASGA